MGDIQVNLRAKFDKASGQQAAQDMAGAVRSAAGNTGGGLASNARGLPPTSQERERLRTSDLRRRKIVEQRYEWQQQRQKEAAAASAASLVKLSMAVTAVIATVRGFGIVTRSITNAMNRSSAFYAKSLTSGGMPLGFTTQKSIIAQAMGVSEDGVHQYAAAFNYLNREMRSAISIQAANAKMLTESSYKWKGAGEGMKAFFSTIAHGIKTLGGDSVVGGFTRMIAALNEKMNESWSELDMMKLAMDFRNEKGLATSRGIDNVLAEIHNAPFKDGEPGKIPTKAMQMQETMGTQEFKDWLKNRKGLPAPAASAKRLESSHWERMGLVIGQGVNSNPLRATEKNTRSAAATLKEIKAFLAPRSSNGYPVGPIPSAP